MQLEAWGKLVRINCSRFLYSDSHRPWSWVLIAKSLFQVLAPLCCNRTEVNISLSLMFIFSSWIRSFILSSKLYIHRCSGWIPLDITIQTAGNKWFLKKSSLYSRFLLSCCSSSSSWSALLLLWLCKYYLADKSLIVFARVSEKIFLKDFQV